MGARKAETFPIQILGLSQIAVDHSLQSRVSTSVEYQREFSEAMLRGDEFPPVVVFFDGKKYWLADGFHRYGARKIVARADRKFDAIRAEIRPGGRREAKVFSAGANQRFSIPRKPEDIRKAVFMLLDDKDWFAKAAALIAKHVGCSSTTINKHRVSYCNENKVKIPELLVTADGHTMRSSIRPDKKTYWKNHQKKCTAFFLSDNGGQVYLGTKEEEAKKSADTYWKQKEENRAGLRPDLLAQFLHLRGFSFKGAAFNPSQYPGLSAYHGHGVVYVSERFERKVGGISGRNFPETVGCLLLARAKIDPGCRAVVACYREDVLPAMLELGEKLGVEFLSPEGLVASLQADGESTPKQERRP